MFHPKKHGKFAMFRESGGTEMGSETVFFHHPRADLAFRKPRWDRPPIAADWPPDDASIAPEFGRRLDLHQIRKTFPILGPFARASSG